MVGDNIRTIRKKQGLTQQELAYKLDISASTVGMYEQNRRTPDAQMLYKIADALDVTTDLLVSNGERSINDVIEAMRSELMYGSGMMFNGEPLTEDDVNAVIEAMKIGAKVALAAAKERKL